MIMTISIIIEMSGKGYALGFSSEKIKVLEDYKIECKVGTSTECFWIK